MSKLADLIRRATRTEPAPMGFASTSAKAKLSMLLVALVHERWSQGIAETLAAGADAFLLAGSPGDSDLAAAVSAADGRPCGLLAPGSDLEPSRNAGLDFVVLDTQTPASALQEEKLGLFLHVRDDLTDIQLRTLDALPLDGLYVEAEAAPATILQQLELRRVSGLTRKALLVHVQPDIEQQDLVSLRDAGAAVAAVDATAGAVRRLRGVIDGLPRPRRSRGDERAEVTLPRAAAPVEDDDELDDEE